MKTVFDKAVREALMARIQTLGPNSSAEWGKMNVFEMAKHCTIWDEWVQGTHPMEYKQELPGRIFGKMALKSHTKSDKPLPKGMPAGKFAVKQQQGDVEAQKKLWMQRVTAYGQYANPDFVHDFFGRMTEAQIGIFAYKHADHHLLQFGA